MTRMLEQGKRFVAVVLALLMLLSCTNGALLTFVKAATEQSSTVGDVLCENYGEDLPAGVQNLLRSQLLKEDTFTYRVPEQGDGLVTVDPEARTVTAAPYENGEYTFYPISAQVTEGADQIDVALTEENGSYVGSFETQGNAYTVAVTYELRVTVDAAVQTALLNAGGELAQGVHNLGALAGEMSTYEMLADNVDVLNRLVEGYTFENGSTIRYLDPDGAIASLDAQTRRNGGKLDLTILLEAYAAAPSKTQYLLEHGDEVKAAAQQTYQDISVLCRDRSTLEMCASLGAALGYDVSLARLVFNSLEATLAAMEPAVAEDAWTVLESNPLKDDITDAEYLILDSLIIGVIEPGYAPEVTIEESLRADTVTLNYNMNRYDVSVRVEIYGITGTDTADTELIASATDVITLADGTSTANVIQEVEDAGTEARALAACDAAYGVNTENYVRTATPLSGPLSGDLEYTITYVPADFTVTHEGIDGIADSLPYGYRLTLPVNEDVTQVYDYTVNGAMYFQGDVYQIVGDTTITRTQDKPWSNYRLADIVASEVSPEAAAVLKSLAVESDSLLLREPGAELIEVTVDGSAYIVRAKSYYSGLNGLYWLPVSAETDNSELLTFTDEGAGSYLATISGDFGQIDVTYELTVNDGTTPEAILAAMNLPGTLAQEAEAQKAELQKLMNEYGHLGDLKDTKLNQLNTFAKGAEGLTDDARQAILDVLDSGVNKTTKCLYLYEYLTEYQQRGLTYYYGAGNYEAIQSQFAFLRERLNLFDQETPNLQELMEENGVGSSYETLRQIINSLNTVELVEPNAAISRNSLQLGALVEAIGNVSPEETYTIEDAQEALTTRVTLTAAPPDKTIVTLTVQVQDSTGKIQKTASQSVSFPTDQVLSDEDVAYLNATLETLAGTAGVDTDHYQRTGELPAEGEVPPTQLIFVWTPKAYDVFVVDGEQIGSFTYDNQVITLPGCTEEGFRYEYDIFGSKVTVGSSDVQYTLSTEQAQRLIDGERIGRTAIDVARQEILNLVDSLNKQFAGQELTYTSGGQQCLMVAAIPVEDANGNLSIVLRVSPRSGFTPQKVLRGVAEAITGSSFEYLTLDGEVLRDDSTIYLQSAVDMLLNSGVGFGTIINDLLLPDGDINEMSLDGSVLGIDAANGIPGEGFYINDANLYGGQMIATSMTLAENSDAASRQVALYITLEDFDLRGSQLKSLRDNLITLRKYVDITLEDGQAKIVANLPDRAYQAFLAAMLVTGNAELHDVNDLDLGAALEYLYALAEPLMLDSTITLDTIENTLDMLGRPKDLSSADTIFSYAQRAVRNLINNSTISNNGAVDNVYSADLNYDVNALLNAVGISDSVKGMVAESQTGLNASLSLTLTNMEKDYQALVIDIDEAGLNKARFVEDAATAIANAHEGAIVILVSDVNGSLTSDKVITIDLNGKTVTGSISGSITLVDNDLSNAGSVGSVDASVKDTRNNNLYRVEENGENVNIYVNVDVLYDESLPTVGTVARDLAYKLVMNYYTSAALNLGGNAIYSFALDDLIGLYSNGLDAATVNSVLDCIDCSGVTEFVNTFISDVTDFNALAAAVAAGEPVLSYGIETSAWDISFVNVNSGEYLSANVHPSDSIGTSQIINIYVEGDSQDEFQQLLEELGGIVTSDISVTLSDISYANKTLTVTGGASASVSLDLSGNPNYAIALGVLLANTVEDNADLVAAIRAYYESGNNVPLKAAIEQATTKQIIDAVKNIRKGTDFAAIVDGLGLTGVVAQDAIDLMDLYRPVLAGAATLLNKVNVTGGGRTIGSLEDSSQPGVYTADKALNLNGSIDVTGSYKLGYIAPIDVDLTVNLFAHQYAIIVTDANGNELYQGDSLVEAFAAAESGATIEVRKAVVLEEDVTLATDVKLNGTENIDFNGKTITLSGDGSIDANAAIADYANVILSGKADSYVEESASNGRYIYTLTLYAVVVTDSTGDIVYTGDSLYDALAAAADGATVQVNKPVTLNADYTLNASITINGGSNITMGSHAIILGKTGEIDADRAFTVGTEIKGISVYTAVKESISGGRYLYVLTVLDPNFEGKTPAVTTGSGIYGAKVDTANRLIYLDVPVDGITLAQFNALVSFSANNASEVETTVNGGCVYDGVTYIPTGAKVTVAATNPDSNVTAIAVYTVIIMGDTNCNARIDSGDAFLMAKHYQKLSLLEGAALLAADMNQNERVDSGDAFLNTRKYQNQDNDSGYVSILQ